MAIHVHREKYENVTSVTIATLLGIADNTVRKAHRDVLDKVEMVLTEQCLRRFRLAREKVFETLKTTTITMSPNLDQDE